MITEIVTVLVALAVVGAFVLVFGGRIMQGVVASAADALTKSMDEKLREERERSAQQRQADQQLIDEKRRAVEGSNTATRDTVKLLIEKLSKEVEMGQSKLEVAEKERIATFNTLKSSLDEYKAVGTGLKESTDDLRKILANNQLRGKYGEEVAENLLKAVGFIKGENYILNTAQDTATSRPDVTLFLPDKTKINIDVKFPFQSLVRFHEAEGKEEKQKHFAQFTTDVKQKIKEVTTRDYVSPEEGTVDFVILFVPNEMIFSVIYEKLHEVWNDALHRKVILAGPFSFTAILRMVFQSYKNFTYQENMRNIIQLVKVFEQEWVKYSDSVDGLGKSLETAQNKYRLMATTRSNKLGRIVDKIKGEDLRLEADDTALLKE